MKSFIIMNYYYISFIIITNYYQKFILTASGESRTSENTNLTEFLYKESLECLMFSQYFTKILHLEEILRNKRFIKPIIPRQLKMFFLPLPVF